MVQRVNLPNIHCLWVKICMNIEDETEKDNPIIVFCPNSLDAFTNIVGKRFEVLETGITEHKIFKYIEQEFIVIAQKSNF